MSIDPPISGTIEDGVHIMPMRVYYEDTDTAGIVYYANYLRFIERARTEILRLCGVDQFTLMNAPAADRISFAVTRAEVDYISPAHLDDIITVKTRTTRVRGASIPMEQDIWRGDDLLLRSFIKAACLNADGAPTRLPRDFVQNAQTLLSLDQ